MHVAEDLVDLWSHPLLATVRGSPLISKLSVSTLGEAAAAECFYTGGGEGERPRLAATVLVALLSNLPRLAELNLIDFVMADGPSQEILGGPDVDMAWIVRNVSSPSIDARATASARLPKEQTRGGRLMDCPKPP